MKTSTYRINHKIYTISLNYLSYFLSSREIDYFFNYFLILLSNRTISYKHPNASLQYSSSNIALN